MRWEARNWISGRGIPEDWEICRNDFVGFETCKNVVSGAVRGDAVALISASIVGRSANKSSVNCAANSGPVALMSSSVGIDVAVVSQRPGNCGDIGLGRTDVDVGMGICRDNDKVGVRLT